MKDIFLQLTSNDLILTPNQRLANTLQKNLTDAHFAQQEHVFIPPTILAYPTFIRFLWRSFLFLMPKKLLSPSEELWLWQKMIVDTPLPQPLLNPHKAATLAQTAWHSLKQWRLNIASLDEDHHNENISIFSQWARQFAQHCMQHHFIDEASALEHYIAHDSFLKNLPYKTIYFYHFIEFSPLQDALIQRLQQVEKSVVLLSPEAKNSSLTRQQPKNTAEELLHLASWAKETYEKDSTLKIACVVPNLQQSRDDIIRNFKTVFVTETPPIDISAGRSLTDYTVIQHMLLLMTLLAPTFDYEYYSAFLRSAYFAASEDEMCERHLIDKALRKSCSKTTSFSEIKKINLEGNLLNEHFSFLEIFKHYSTHSLTAWIETWLNLLKQLGWPGQRNLNSTEYQVVKRFIDLLHELENFSYLQPSWRWQDVAFLLKTQCQKTIFQPESEKTAIQILGLLEASGMEFDAMWIMGLDDTTWPTTPSPNPFLPYALQKKHALPHASAEREYVFCKELLEQLIQSTPDVIVSCPEFDDNKKFRPSPLIANLSITFPEFSLPNPKKHDIASDYIIDENAPLVTEEENIHGGSSIVQYQAQCPFKAFATIRLHAEPLQQPLDALDALTRGNIVHRVLELFWKEIKSSNNLATLTFTEIDAYLEKIIATIYPLNKKDSLFLVELEKIRLKKLIHAWLDVEKTRSPFTVIATEESCHYQYKTITLRLRIDRIDQANDSSYIIIDYKTGTPDSKHWLEARLKEPQLPLYCISQTTQLIDSLYFAQLRWNDVCLKGGSFDDFSPDLRQSNWPTQILFWKNSIHQLLDDFLAGKAKVDPIDEMTCSHCHLQSLCRIFEKDDHVAVI